MQNEHLSYKELKAETELFEVNEQFNLILFFSTMKRWGKV